MATKGTAVVDFGAGLGDFSAQVDVTGQGGIVSGSRVEAWLEVPAGGANDHTDDEYWAEDLHVYAGKIVAGVGFTIFAKCNTGRSTGQWRVSWVWS